MEWRVASPTRIQWCGFSWGYRLPLEKFPFLKGKIGSNSSYMDEIAVRGNSRQIGTGTLLGKAYVKTAENQGIDEVVLRTDIWNEASMSLFKKLGFRSLGIFDPEYGNRIYLSKTLGGENAS